MRDNLSLSDIVFVFIALLLVMALLIQVFGWF